MENNKITPTLTTDSSAAYDTINLKIMYLKLEHFGIRGKNLELLKSYFTDKKQFVKIDTFSSNIVDSLQCGIVQGSKLSSIFYTLYTNESTPFIQTNE